MQVQGLDSAPWNVAPVRRLINNQTGTTFDASGSANENSMVTLSNAAPITVTLPSNTGWPFPIGVEIDFLWLGVGQPSFVAGSGATVTVPTGLSPSIRAEGGAVTAKKVATNDWELRGDLTGYVVGAGGGGTTILNGSGAPSGTTGVDGNYYEDTTNGVLYGPKNSAGFGTDQIITIAGAPTGSDGNVEAGVRVTFAKAGRVTGVRYRRVSINTPLLTFRAWDSGGSKLGEVTDSQGTATGQFTVNFATPITVAAGTYTFSVSAVDTPRFFDGNPGQAVTPTTDVSFVGYYQGTTNTRPTSVQTIVTYFVEPIYQPTLNWPIAVRTITTEDAVDAVATAIVAGTNVTVTYNDAANTITIASTGGGGSGLPAGGTDEQVLVKNSSTDGDASWKTLTPTVVKATEPVAADYGLASIPVGAVWIQSA